MSFRTKIVLDQQLSAVADIGFGKGGGFLKSGLFEFLRTFLSGGKGVWGAPLAPPEGSGAEPQLQARGSGERFEIPQRDLGRSPSRQRILVYLRANAMHFRAT